MAVVRIDFDGGDVPILAGEEPDSPDDPVIEPVDTGCVTNAPAVMAAQDYCFALKTDKKYSPLWQTGQAVDGQTLVLKFELV